MMDDHNDDEIDREMEDVEIGVSNEESFEIDPPSVSCCYRLRSELKWSYPFFSLDECNGTDLHVEKTFAPTPVILTAFLRLFFLALTIVPIATSIWNYPEENRWIWMGFLTHWTAVVTTAYFLAMLLCTVIRSTLKQPRKGEPASKFVRLTWALYSLAAPMNILVVLLYWTLDYEPGQTITFHTIMLHAGTAAAVLLDGNFVSRIPIRMKHMSLVFTVGLLFVVWTIANDYAGLGDGVWPGEDADQANADDHLYSVLSWTTNPKKATIISVVVLFVVIPLMFLLCWSFSMIGCCNCSGSRRHLYQEGEVDITAKSDTNKVDFDGNNAKSDTSKVDFDGDSVEVTAAVY